MWRRKKKLEGGVTLSTRVVAEKIPAEDPQAITAVRVLDSTVPHVSNSDVDEAGAVTYTIKGEPQTGETGTRLAAEYVVSRLNSAGANWRDLEATSGDAKTERGVDFIAMDDEGGSLHLQVTRAERGAWKELATKGAASLTITVQDLVADLLEAIRSKKRHADPTVWLIVDATGAPHFADPRVIEQFQLRHAADARSLGFAGVWLATPTTARTVRLDVQGSVGLREKL